MFACYPQTSVQEKYRDQNAEYNSIWMLFVMIALFDLNLEQSNVLKKCLLGINLKRLFTLHQREMFIVKGKEVRVCKLKKLINLKV
jgi:hypothetical protein